MRYTISIDQTHSIEWGLSLSEAALFSFIYSLPAWAEQIHTKGETWFFASRNKAIDEMPIITDKADTIYRLYKSLQLKGIIRWEKFGEKDCIMITEKGKNWNSSKTDLGNKSDLTRKKIREKTELNPTYNSTKNNNTNNNNISSKNSNEFCQNEEEIYFEDLEEFPIFESVEIKSVSVKKNEKQKLNPFQVVSDVEKERKENFASKEKKEAPERKPNPNYEAFTIFCQTFEQLSGANYPTDQNGNYIMMPKDAGNMVYLMRFIDKIDRNGNSHEALKIFMQAAWSLNDKWLKANFTIANLYSQASKIFTAYQTSSPAAKDKAYNDRLAELLAERMAKFED
jgi:hypothetical protein